MSINIGPASDDDLRPKIMVVGVGGAGGNAIANMMQAEIEGVDFIVANTDAQALSTSPSEKRIQLGPDITGGLGAGARPEVGKALKAMGFSGAQGGQVVLTGGGAELHGIAEFMQGALGRPVRIGKPPVLQGLPEAHATPGFATLAGLCLYASDDPVDIRSVGPRYQPTKRYRGMGLINRVLLAVREYF